MIDHSKVVLTMRGYNNGNEHIYISAMIDATVVNILPDKSRQMIVLNLDKPLNLPSVDTWNQIMIAWPKNSIWSKIVRVFGA